MKWVIVIETRYKSCESELNGIGLLKVDGDMGSLEPLVGLRAHMLGVKVSRDFRDPVRHRFGHLPSCSVESP